MNAFKSFDRPLTKEECPMLYNDFELITEKGKSTCNFDRKDILFERNNCIGLPVTLEITRIQLTPQVYKNLVQVLIIPKEDYFVMRIVYKGE